MRSWLLGLFLLPLIVKAQPCSNTPGMTPPTAIPVCGTSLFTQMNVSSCSAPNIPNASACPSEAVTSNNSFWYKFHCFQTGTLGFLIVPNGSADDYDWEVFDLTGHAPNDVYSFESMRVSLNLSGQTGSTGCTNTGSGNSHCGGGAAGTQYNAMPTITAGSDYLLMVTNWSNSGLGYRLNFTGGSAVITDPIPPTISNVITGCNNTSIGVTFSKDIRCSSVTASGSEFKIMPGNISPFSISSQCAAGFNSITQLTLNVPALGTGNYTLIVNDGTDFNTFDDVCGNEVTPGSQFPFSIVAQTPGVISNISFSGCVPASFDVQLSNPVLCSSISGNGSEFAITPGNPTILSVQSPDCIAGQTFTKQLHINLQNPLPYGNYQLVLQNGTDGNTLIDTCTTPMQPANVPFVINQTTAPVIRTIDFNECHPDQLSIEFDKAVACNSISATASEFVINPGNIAVTSISSNCSAGSYATQFVLQLANPLPAGNFSVVINNGSDANTISDTCFSFIAAGYSKSFVTTQAPAPVFDSVVFNKCNPASIRAYYSKPVKCSSVSADGSEYFITGAAAVTITGATTDVTCSQGYTNWIDISFSQPINVTGLFTLHNKVGTDGNGIMDTCGAVQSINETINFNAFAKPSATFNSQVQWGCINDTIVLSHPGGNGVNSWLWDFSDNSTASGQNVSHMFPVSTVTATIRLIISNNQCSDTSTVNITLDNSINADFTISSDTSCLGKPVSFTNTSTGNNLSYAWKFGDNTSFNGKDPLPHVYNANNRFDVVLIITNNHACSDTATHAVVITPMAQADFTGLRPSYCSGDNVSLSASLQGNFSSYVWDNGGGLSFTNQPTVSFVYINENNYNVTLTAQDRFCGQVQVSKPTKVFKTPVFSLGNDTTFCPGLSAIIGVQNNPAYTYLWNTGDTNPAITTGQLSRNYILTINNNGCVASDEINVKVLLTCLIKVPNAFTPNDDGLNDRLKAINADLATQFVLSVYNRFGQRVFYSTNPLKGWDGTYKGLPAETGTYVWQISYVDPVSKKLVFDKGTSILIR